MSDQEKKPTILCPSCKAPVPDGDKFCGVCGVTMPVQRLCPQCGAPVSETMKFCEQCGTPLTQPAVAAQAVPVPPPSSPPPPPSHPPVSPVPEPALVQQPAASEQPSWYIPPAGKKPEPQEQEVTHLQTPPSGAKTPLPVQETTPAAEPGSFTMTRTAAPKPGIMGNKKILIGAVAGILILISVAVLILPELNGSPSAPGLGTVFSGLGQPQPSPPAAVPSATVSLSSAISMVPGPTQNMPASTNVIIQADKDTITGDVSIQIAGGPGRAVIKEVRATLYRSDGQTMKGIINPATRSEEVVIPGTKGNDRIQVTVVLFSGESYTVIDKLLVYRDRR